VSDVIDHVGIRVGDLPASRRMYEAALAELGFSVSGEGEFEGDAYVLFGRGGSDDFSLHTVGNDPGRDHVTTAAHVGSARPTLRLWGAGTMPQYVTVVRTTANLVCGRSTAGSTLRPSSSIPTATTSRPSSTDQSPPPPGAKPRPRRIPLGQSRTLARASMISSQ
jgi:hypothetical protein